MENEILKKANRVRIEAERKLEDVFLNNDELMGITISVEVRISNVPYKFMPENSKVITYSDEKRTYLSYHANQQLDIVSESYEADELTELLKTNQVK